MPGPTTTGRPYVVLNMVSSVDGGAAVGGKASGIGSPEDRRAMRTLRSLVDAVMVGAGTVRAEKLNLGLDEPARRQPLAVIVCGSGDVALDRLLAATHQEILLVVPAGVRVNHPVQTLKLPASGRGRVDLQKVLQTLGRDHGVRRLLVEGGPSLNRSLLDHDLVDEIFLTVAPKILPGGGPNILSPAHHLDTPVRDLELLGVHAAGDELFLRYRVRRA